MRQIKAIRDYATYKTIIEGCRDAADDLGCLLIEVEQLWEGADYETQPNFSFQRRRLALLGAAAEAGGSTDHEDPSR